LLKIKELTKDQKNLGRDFSQKIEVSGKDVLGYRIIQETYHQDKLVSTRGICRLFKNNKKIRFVYPIHETIRESIKKLNGRIANIRITIKNYPEITKKKKQYYLKLLEIKKERFPDSNAAREIALEN